MYYRDQLETPPIKVCLFGGVARLFEEFLLPGKLPHAELGQTRGCLIYLLGNVHFVQYGVHSKSFRGFLRGPRTEFIVAANFRL
jgi:hypothetical protein